MHRADATCDVDVPMDRPLEAPGLDQGDRVEEISVSKKINQSTKVVRLSPNFLQSNASGHLRPRGKLNQGETDIKRAKGFLAPVFDLFFFARGLARD